MSDGLLAWMNWLEMDEIKLTYIHDPNLCLVRAIASIPALASKRAFEPCSRNLCSAASDSVSKDYSSAIINSLKFASSLLEKMSEQVPIPGLKAAFGSVNFIIERFDVGLYICMAWKLLNSESQKAKQNTTDFGFLASSIDEWNSVLKRVSPLRMSAESRDQLQTMARYFLPVFTHCVDCK
jgi:hypothetical protein